MAGPLLFLLVVAVIVVAAYFAWQAKQKRREALQRFAIQHDLEFSVADPYGIPVTYPFHLFGLGDSRRCENVMRGSWQGLPVREADYWYAMDSSDGKRTMVRDYHRFSVVVADVACILPHVRVEKKDLFGKFAGHVALQDIEFESEAFNRCYQVRADDREFAYKLLDPRMIRWLESLRGAFGFEVAGSNLLVWSPKRRPTELIPLFGSARMFCDHIPRLVGNEYGSGPDRPDIPAARRGERSAT